MTAAIVLSVLFGATVALVGVNFAMARCDPRERRARRRVVPSPAVLLLLAALLIAAAMGVTITPVAP